MFKVLSILFLLLLTSSLSFQLLSSRSILGQRNGNDLVMRERKCDLAGTRQNSKCMRVSKSNAHTHRVQYPNLQVKKLWWEEGNKFVRLRITCRTLKTIQKNGLDVTAKKFGVDLNKFSLSSGTAPPKTEVIVEA